MNGDGVHPDGPAVTAHDAGLSGCRGCGRVWPSDHSRCGCCGANLMPPVRRGLWKVWAWWVAGLIFYIPANLLPMMRTRTFAGLLGHSEATILEGVAELIRHGSHDIAIVVFVASIVVPITKFLAIAWLAIVAGRSAKPNQVYPRLRIYRVVEFIGRWSMIDVFVVAILSALVQLGFIVSIHPGPAAVCFALSVACTMLAAQSFDPRLIWRGLSL